MRALKLFPLVLVLGLLVPCVQSSAADQSFAVVVDAVEKIRAHYINAVEERTIVEAAIDGLLGLPRVDRRILDKKGSQSNAKSTPPQQDQNPMARLEEAFTLMRRAYSKQIADQSFVDAAIERMVDSLDQQSRYINEDEWRNHLIAQKTGGTGLEFKIDAERVKIVRVIEASPADRAGLAPGDFLVAIDRAPVKGLTWTKIYEKLHGPLGSDVALTVSREDQPKAQDKSQPKPQAKSQAKTLEATLTRTRIFGPSVRFRLYGDIAYIRISRFNDWTVDRLKDNFETLAAQIDAAKLAGYVIDLRNNPGGEFDKTIAVTEMFLPPGPIASTRGRDGKAERFEAKSGGVLGDKPRVVLINESTAGGAEVMAAALQDRGRAVVVGTTSFGQGTVQTVIPLGDDKGALRLTTSLVLRPSGDEIDERGVTPDVVVDLPPGSTAEAQDAGSMDPQLAEAMRRLRNDQRP